MVEDAVKYIIPRDPIKRMHGLSGPLSNLFRLKKGRHRICWAASSATRRVCILFISETLRKEGDANDPYNVFTKLVLAGEFDEIIGRLREP
jgi:mRNA-degrading endonuclease RelE of RelBE toxin-antitoxin system